MTRAEAAKTLRNTFLQTDVRYTEGLDADPRYIRGTCHVYGLEIAARWRHGQDNIGRLGVLKRVEQFVALMVMCNWFGKCLGVV